MNRYMVFYGYDYYPNGGWKDFRAAFDTLEGALEMVANKPSSIDWWHIVDANTGEIVKESIRSREG
jgi:hypothetical protein